MNKYVVYAMLISIVCGVCACSVSMCPFTSQEYLQALHDCYEEWLGNEKHHSWHGNAPVLVRVSTYILFGVGLVTKHREEPVLALIRVHQGDVVPLICQFVTLSMVLKGVPQE